MGTSTRVALVSGLLGAVLGALATWLVRTRDDGTPAGGPAAASAPAPDADRAPAIAPPGGPRLDQAPATSAPKRDAGSFAAAIQALEVELVPGQGRITGLVRTNDGEPLAGAVVRGFPIRRRSTPTRRGTVPPVPTVEREVRASALDLKRIAAGFRETRTDGSGQYVLADLASAEYEVAAYAEGYVLEAEEKTPAYRVIDGATVNFRGRPIVLVPITVLGADGAQAREASIRWSLPKGGGGGGSWWTKEDPVVEMAPGTWSIVAEVGDGLRSAPKSVVAGATLEPVVLRLEVRNGIEGTVSFDSADKYWTFAFVEARRRGAPADQRAAMQLARAPEWNFHFRDLEVGDYDVSVSLTESAPLVVGLVHVEGGTGTIELAVPRLGPSQVLEAAVYGPDGGPIEESEVQFGLSVRTANSLVGIGTRPLRRPDGIFLIPLASPRKATLGRTQGEGAGPEAGPGSPSAPLPEDGAAQWVLRVYSKAHGNREAEFVFGVTPRVEVRYR